MDLDEAVTYRLAFGIAYRLGEADDANHTGRLRSNRAAGGQRPRSWRKSSAS